MSTQKPLNIVFVSHSSASTGAEMALLNLASELKTHAKTRPLVVLPSTGDLTDRLSAQGIAWFIGPVRHWFPLSRTGRIITDDQRLHALFRDVEALASLLRALEPDVVVVNTIVIPQALLAAFLLCVPVVLYSHGFVTPSHVPPQSLFDTGLYLDTGRMRLIEKLLLPWVDKVLVPSEFVARSMEDEISLPMFKVDVVPAAIPIPRDFSEGDRKKLLLDRPLLVSWAATLEPYKNPLMMIEAARKFKNRYASLPVRFELYGAGERMYVAYLNNEVLRAGVEDIVSICPRVPEIRDVYRKSAVFVVTSNLESFSRVLLEAMAEGCPVISTRCGGPEEIVENGRSGFLVDRNDSDGLVEILLRLLLDPALNMAIGREGRKRAEYFEIKRACEKVEALLVELAAKRGRPECYRSWTGRSQFARVIVGCVFSEFDKSGSQEEPSSFVLACDVPQHAPISHFLVKHRLTYHFVPNHAYWGGLDVLIGTHQRAADGKLALTVRSTSGVLLREIFASLSGARDNDWLALRFEPISNSEGQLFVLEFALADAGPGILVSLYDSGPPDNLFHRLLRLARIRLPRNSLYCRSYYAIEYSAVLN